MPRIGALIVLLLVAGLWATAARPPEELTPERRQELEKKAAALTEEGGRHYRAGNFVKAIEVFREALEVNRTLYPKAKYPKGHLDLATSLNDLGFMYKAAGDFGKAEPLLGEALAICRDLYLKEKYPDGHPDLAASINSLGLLHKDAGDYVRAEPLLREAVVMNRALYPKAKYPDGHPYLAISLNNFGLLYWGTGEYGKAESLYREALDMRRVLYFKAKYPNGHPEVANTLNNLGTLHWYAGEYGKAEPLYREALAMYRALYPKGKFPNGHPTLATSLGSLAALHRSAGELTKAEPLYREALEMTRALYTKTKYPNGHPQLARTILTLGNLYEATEELGRAEALLGEALVMCRDVYPKAKFPEGHPELARSIHDLGYLHCCTGEADKAKALLSEALDMRRALYPTPKFPAGHPDLAQSLNNLGFLHQADGEPNKAEQLFREALAMYRALLHRYADLAAEAEALNFAATQPRTRDLLLSVTRDRPSAAAVYDEVWSWRALLTRLQEQRHRQLAASRDPNLRDLAEELRLARLSLSRRLLRPLNDAAANRAEIARFTDTKEDLEKRLAAKMKLAALPTAGVPGSWRLAELLPAGTCFVDLDRYVYFEQDAEIKGKKGAKQTLHYVAFVVRPGAATVRVELGDAATIEQAWTDWHNAIVATRPDAAAEREAAAALGRHIWAPLRKVLPSKLQTVYLTADEALHQVPWGAMPGARPGTVLLEDHAICLVPHGPFLLNRLQEKTSTEEAAVGRLLAIGGIDYQDCAAATEVSAIVLREAALRAGGVRWPTLAGTAKERQQVAALARRTAHLEVTDRSGKEATTEQFQRDLPLARYAHIATHGFFADPKFRSALQIDPNEFGAGGVRDRRGGARSPLSLSGLVFAGANRSGKEAADDRGILTAEGLIGVRMEGLELAVLSACETGLGAYGGGEGTYGLQRAFHVAGCRNVVASLWKVDDDATQALMALFYANLWQKKLDPAEALRQAQLTLYRNPSAVAVAKKRGVDFTESDLPKVEEKPEEKGRRTPTAQWAAFTFSGVRPVKAD